MAFEATHRNGVAAKVSLPSPVFPRAPRATDMARNLREGIGVSRVAAMGRAQAYFDDGSFIADLGRRVAIPSSSQESSRADACLDYLRDEIAPALALLGCT